MDVFLRYAAYINPLEAPQKVAKKLESFEMHLEYNTRTYKIFVENHPPISTLRSAGVHAYLHPPIWCP